MEYRNPILTESGTVDCEINHPDFGWIPFTACETDIEELGRTLFTQIKADGSVKPYVPDSELAAARARVLRDGLLAESDWTQAADVPQELKDIWATYRKELRDISTQQGFPLHIEWPKKP